MKPGWKTSEFYVNFVAIIVIVLLNAGILPAESELTSGLGSIAAALTAAGYGLSRATVKKNVAT